ncbi:NADH-ubiquinone oxidoreductase 75 kDa subunit [Striga asiatica]|uniref:NADH-ubiquinone oxidoreductase 75 kDa subunit n=1 Tax=Striga asiatica TaxID=4170 RepID=A0A5A7R710_STRAF|nr:NADH-ubiquinone oxidoreductase 75 kDa subunit [Striga asiatica]
MLVTDSSPEMSSTSRSSKFFRLSSFSRLLQSLRIRISSLKLLGRDLILRQDKLRFLMFGMSLKKWSGIFSRLIEPDSSKAVRCSHTRYGGVISRIWSTVSKNSQPLTTSSRSLLISEIGSGKYLPILDRVAARIENFAHLDFPDVISLQNERRYFRRSLGDHRFYGPVPDRDLPEPAFESRGEAQTDALEETVVFPNVELERPGPARHDVARFLILEQPELEELDQDSVALLVRVLDSREMT